MPRTFTEVMTFNGRIAMPSDLLEIGETWHDHGKLNRVLVIVIVIVIVRS